MHPAVDHDVTLVQKLRSCAGHVDPLVMDQATNPVEKHLLRQLAISSEQNIILGDTLQRVVYQTTKTNGRLMKCEEELEVVAQKAETVKDELDAWHLTQKHWRKLLLYSVTIFGPVIYIIIDKLFNRFWK